jgi:hypothetical protein
MHEIYEVGKNLDLSPFGMEKRVRDAGFVDVEAKYATYDIGDWRDGTHIRIRLIKDCKSKEGARAGRISWVKVIPPIVETMKEYYPDKRARAAFVQRVINDLENEAYHLYTPMYALQCQN